MGGNEATDPRKAFSTSWILQEPARGHTFQLKIEPGLVCKRVASDEEYPVPEHGIFEL
jgi:hypothetical protein